MRRFGTMALACALAAVGLAACGGAQTKEAAPVVAEAPVAPVAAAAQPEDAPVPPPGTPWDSMTPPQHLAVMKHVMLPKLGAAFTAFDGKRFAKVTCATCHGEDAKARMFKMPNPGLFKLPTDMAGFQKLAAEKPEMVKFMGGTVGPMAAEIIGEPHYDPKTGKGFGCMGCHTAVAK